MEIENSEESDIATGFVVEKVDLKIGGEGVKVTLIGWGDWVKCGKENIPFEDWTLAQYNLLYAISF